MFNSKFLALGALAAAAAISAPAFALVQGDVDLVAGVTADEYYIAGSSAIDKTLATFVANLCTAGTLDTYQDIDTTGVKGGLWTVYSCTFDAASPYIPAGTAGHKSLIYKRSKIGSVFGALPILNNGYVEFMNIKTGRGSGLCVADSAANTYNCTVAGSGSAARDSTNQATRPVADECDYTLTAPANGASGAAIIPIASGLDTICRRASLGLSDNETEIFQGDNLPKAPFTFAAATKAQMDTAYGTAAGTATRYRTAGQIFGIALSNSVWNALQTAQGLTGLPLADGSNWPSLSKAQIRGILTGNLTTWSSVSQSIAGLGALDTIGVCRRENGSGTQATTNLFFMDYPCTGYTHSAVDTGNVAAGTFFVQENSTSNYVKACLNEAEIAGQNANPNGAFGAIGLLAYSGDPETKVAADTVNYRWIKIDGIFPSMQNAVTGKYEFWAELQSSYNKTLAGTEKAFATNLINEIRLPSRISAVGAAKGIAALPLIGGAGLNAWEAPNNTAFSQYTGTNPVMGGVHGANGAGYKNAEAPPYSCRSIILSPDTAAAPNR